MVKPEKKPENSEGIIYNEAKNNEGRMEEYST